MKLFYISICAICLNFGINTSAMSECKITEHTDRFEVDCSEAFDAKGTTTIESTDIKTDNINVGKIDKIYMNNYNENSNLLQLLGSKEFWSEFKWKNFEESELYKATEWHPPGWSGNGNIANVTRSNTYSTDIRLERLNIRSMTLYIRSDRIGLLSVHGTSPNESFEDYKKLVSWCNERFGEATVKDEQTETRDKNNRDTIETSWTIGTTIISVKHSIEVFTNGTSRNFNKISFNRNIAVSDGERKTEALRNNM